MTEKTENVIVRPANLTKDKFGTDIILLPLKTDEHIAELNRNNCSNPCSRRCRCKEPCRSCCRKNSEDVYLSEEGSAENKEFDGIILLRNVSDDKALIDVIDCKVSDEIDNENPEAGNEAIEDGRQVTLIGDGWKDYIRSVTDDRTECGIKISKKKLSEIVTAGWRKYIKNLRESEEKFPDKYFVSADPDAPPRASDFLYSNRRRTFTWLQAQQIRDEFVKNRTEPYKLAEKYGCKTGVIRNILTYRGYRVPVRGVDYV